MPTISFARLIDQSKLKHSQYFHSFIPFLNSKRIRANQTSKSTPGKRIEAPTKV